MIKGLAITPPVIGRISIGKLVQQGDRWLPEKDDAFTLTTQVQTRNGWLLHPLHRHYSEACGSGKLRTLPVRLPFNDSGLNLRAEYSAFDRRTGRRVGSNSCHRGFFYVGRIIAAAAVNNFRLTGVGDYHEFVRTTAADRAGIRFNRTKT